MNALKALVVKGQIVLDDPVDLPEGAEPRLSGPPAADPELHVHLHNSEGDALSDLDRAALHRSLQRGIKQADAGELIDADEVLSEPPRRNA